MVRAFQKLAAISWWLVVHGLVFVTSLHDFGRGGNHGTLRRQLGWSASLRSRAERGHHLNNGGRARYPCRAILRAEAAEWGHSALPARIACLRPTSCRPYSSVNHWASTRRFWSLSVPMGSSQPRPTISSRLASALYFSTRRRLISFALCLLNSTAFNAI